jgi:hypothetical protein
VNSTPDPKRVLARIKTAGEVRFVKDRGDDASSWAWADRPPSKREIHPEFAFDPKKSQILARILRSTMMSLGHTMAAYSAFAKLKSADISPDGSLGGKGYIQNIKDMRRSYMNTIEALSAMADTFYDEIHAPHWAALSRQEDPEDKAELAAVLQETEEIRDDPEAWAKEVEDDLEENFQDELPQPEESDPESEVELEVVDDGEDPESEGESPSVERLASAFHTRVLGQTLGFLERIQDRDPSWRGVKVWLQNANVWIQEAESLRSRDKMRSEEIYGDVRKVLDLALKTSYRMSLDAKDDSDAAWEDSQAWYEVYAQVKFVVNYIGAK